MQPDEPSKIKFLWVLKVLEGSGVSIEGPKSECQWKLVERAVKPKGNSTHCLVAVQQAILFSRVQGYSVSQAHHVLIKLMSRRASNLWRTCHPPGTQFKQPGRSKFFTGEIFTFEMLYYSDLPGEPHQSHIREFIQKPIWIRAYIGMWKSTCNGQQKEHHNMGLCHPCMILQLPKR